MKCVLFDLDGTLADTEVLKAKALASSVQTFGGTASHELYKSIMGQSWEAVTGTFFRHAGIEVSLDRFNPIFREEYSRLIDSDLSTNTAVSEFIKFLKLKNISIGLVSSASPWMIQKTLSKLRLENTFDVIVSNAEVERHKPHPDAYLFALEKLAVASRDSIAFEDSEPGVQAAIEAGLKVYGIRHSYNELHDFSRCAYTFSSFEDLELMRVLNE
jgi:HAD superfamily hydrolase (TIGR01509 family)